MTETASSFKLRPGCGFYYDVFDKAPKIKTDKLIPIATRVKYSAEAAVVRWKQQYKLWKLVEPAYDVYPRIEEKDEKDDDHFMLINDGPRDFWGTPIDKINKNIVVWKATGVAYVFGFVKRGIGWSSPASYSGGGYEYEPEYDPGFFDASRGYVPLYALKSQLQGVGYFFAPIQSVEIA